MHRLARLPLSAMLLIGLSVLACLPCRADREVIAEPAVITPGQTVKLRWYFTGTKVVVSGGRFGAGQVVTGKTLVTDTPKVTTTYRFDVYYTVTKPAETGEIRSQALHQHYSVTALVDTSPPDHFKQYVGTRGWKIDYLAAWHCDVSTPDNGSKSLLFFQKEFDSVERMAVAILPAAENTPDKIIAKALLDAPARYNNLAFEPTTSFKFDGLDASTATFSGDDDSHPGVRTTSLLYAIVFDGRAYVLSVRTRASNFLLRRSHLEHMLKSFVLPRNASEYPPTDDTRRRTRRI